MKEITSIFVRSRHENDDSGSVCSEHLERLEVLFPDLIQIGRNGKELVLLNAENGDDRIKNILDELVRFSVDIWSRDSAVSGVGVSKQRIYLEEELNQADYLHNCNAEKSFLGEMSYPRVCDPAGIPVLAGKPRQKARSFGTLEPPCWTCFVARGDIKEKIESMDFVGLSMHPVKLKSGRNSNDGEQLWVVWSNLTLPPVKNIFNGDGGKCGVAVEMLEKYENLEPAEGYASQAELHYQRELFEAVGKFDIALMREPVKVQGVFTKNLIFSQRFRRFVIEELGVPFKGIPVCIDDDDLIPWEGPYPVKWSHLNRRPEWLEKLQAEVSRRKFERP